MALILISTIIVISVIFFGYKYLNNLDNINFYMHYMHVIGYGKGYYDRALHDLSSNKKILTIGIINMRFMF